MKIISCTCRTNPDIPEVSIEMLAVLGQLPSEAATAYLDSIPENAACQVPHSRWFISGEPVMEVTR